MQSNTKKKMKHRVVGQKQITWFCIAMLAFPIIHIIVFDLFGNFEGLLLIFKTYDYDNMEYVWLWKIFPCFTISNKAGNYISARESKARHMVARGVISGIISFISLWDCRLFLRGICADISFSKNFRLQARFILFISFPRFYPRW